VQTDDLRSALRQLEKWGERPIRIATRLDNACELAGHYLHNFAASPATSRDGAEPCVLYENTPGGMPVLMGMFGSRQRNEILLHGTPGDGARRLAARLGMRIPCEINGEPPCREVVRPEKLAALPILTATRFDAGPYITSGLVCARDPENGVVNLSIHRMRVLGPDRLTIWMLPGRDLERMYQKALARGMSLPVSINIGVSPAIYLTSSISSPFLGPGESELDLAGAIQGVPVQISRCVTNDGICISRSEIVIEGAISACTEDEFSDPEARWAMPEFLGYMGKGRAQLPVIHVSQVSHRNDAIYQTFFGPGKEQSELLAIPAEAGMLAHLADAFRGEFSFLDAHYLAPAGGQLMLALKIKRHIDNPDAMARLRDAVISRHQLTKAVLVVDDDVDLHSNDDLIWAMSTRFQPGRDLYLRPSEPGFPLDPSQAAGYLGGTVPLTNKYLMDMTVPLGDRAAFARCGVF
jgi:gallate decarboxylase subunit C